MTIEILSNQGTDLISLYVDGKNRDLIKKVWGLDLVS